jgi:hypothetical protein
VPAAAAACCFCHTAPNTGVTCTLFSNNTCILMHLCLVLPSDNCVAASDIAVVLLLYCVLQRRASLDSGPPCWHVLSWCRMRRTQTHSPTSQVRPAAAVHGLTRVVFMPCSEAGQQWVGGRGGGEGRMRRTQTHSPTSQVRHILYVECSQVPGAAYTSCFHTLDGGRCNRSTHHCNSSRVFDCVLERQQRQLRRGC